MNGAGNFKLYKSPLLDLILHDYKSKSLRATPIQTVANSDTLHAHVYPA